MSKLARALSLAALLAAMQLATMATVAQAQTTDRQVEVAWRARLAASQQPQPTGDATLRRVLAREQFSIPSRAPTSMPPAGPSGHRPALRALASGVAVVAAGAGLLAARHATRTHRASQTA